MLSFRLFFNAYDDTHVSYFIRNISIRKEAQKEAKTLKIDNFVR